MTSINVPVAQRDVIETLKNEYTDYLAAQDRHDSAAIEACMSPSCWQIARQDSSWNLGSRAEIMRILTSTRELDEKKTQDKGRGKVDMRALTQDEKDTLPDAQKAQAAEEGWEGLRVVLEDADLHGRIVRVNYYWRLEGGRWVQCLHDLLWVGPRIEGAFNDVGATVFGQQE